jgi:hypothetical protein
MSDKRKVAGTINDATLPKTPIIIGGTEYSLCFDFGALSTAETELNREGHEVNLLAMLPVLNLSNTRVIFAAALRKFHPDITFDQAVGMVNFGNVYTIANAIAEAWQSALPEPEKEKNAPAAE